MGPISQGCKIYRAKILIKRYLKEEGIIAKEHRKWPRVRRSMVPYSRTRGGWQMLAHSEIRYLRTT